MTDNLRVFRRRKYYPYAVGVAKTGAGWSKMGEGTMRRLIEAWDDDEFCELAAADCTSAEQIRQWREWCARLDTGGGLPHLLYISAAPPLRIIAFLEDIQF